MAPAKVLHGAVRLQGLTSSPTPETHVRVACADAEKETTIETTATAKILKLFIVPPAEGRRLMRRHAPGSVVYMTSLYVLFDVNSVS
jgi:hypothetical protein